MKFLKTYDNFINESITYKTEQEEDEYTINVTDDKKKIGFLSIETMYSAYWYFENEFTEDEYDTMFPGDVVFKIGHLEVNKKYRGKGIAKELMKQAIEIAKKDGHDYIYLNASPMGNDGRSLNALIYFYKQFGFKELLHQGGNCQMLLKLDNSIKEAAKPVVPDDIRLERIKQNTEIAKENGLDVNGDYIRLYQGTSKSNMNKIFKSGRLNAHTWLAKDFEISKRYAMGMSGDKWAVDTMWIYMGSIVYNGYFSTQEELFNTTSNFYKPKNLKMVKESLEDNNFKKWFGDSKVVDIKGNPLVVYHGTNTKFKKFDKSKQIFGHHGKGFYFGSKEYAEEYYGKNYISAYLKVSKLFDLYKEYTIDEIKDIFKSDYHLIEDTIKEESEYNDKIPGYIFYVTAGNERLQKAGYDGLKQDWVYVVFEPNQIKSIKNDGSFDLNDDNIYS